MSLRKPLQDRAAAAVAELHTGHTLTRNDLFPSSEQPPSFLLGCWLGLGCCWFRGWEGCCLGSSLGQAGFHSVHCVANLAAHLCEGKKEKGKRQAKVADLAAHLCEGEKGKQNEPPYHVSTTARLRGELLFCAHLGEVDAHAAGRYELDVTSSKRWCETFYTCNGC